MEYHEALKIATAVKAQLEPHCETVCIAGSIRRRRPTVKDIELVIVPKPYETGLFASGIATVVNEWPRVKGELPCRYTQRKLPEGIMLDLFIADRNNLGYIYAIRTGPWEYSKYLMGCAKRRGYTPKEGYLYRQRQGHNIMTPSPSEAVFFKQIGVKHEAPHLRHVPHDPQPTGYILNIDKRAYA